MSEKSKKSGGCVIIDGVEVTEMPRIMDGKWYAELEAQLTKALETFNGVYVDREVSPEENEVLTKAIQTSKLAAAGQELPGTALHPVACEFWHIGFLGSVWLDTNFNGKNVRVAFIPEKDRFVIQ